MPRAIVVILVLLMMPPLPVRAQPDVWLRVDSGNVFVLTPGHPEWAPAAPRMQVPAAAFLLTHEDARAMLFRATESYDVPQGSYFFVDDAFPRSRLELVDALTRIEASQLPGSREADDAPQRPFGLTYGAPVPPPPAAISVPYELERRRAVAHFYTSGRFDAALLSLKRSMIRFPELYADEQLVELLLNLYARFKLYGFVLDECERLMERPHVEPVAEVVQQWREIAERELAVAPR